MRKLMMALGVVVVVGAIGSVSVEAQRLGVPGSGRPGVGGRGGGGPVLQGLRRGRPMLAIRGFRQLDLTEAQKAEVKSIVAAARAEARPLVQEIRAKRQSVRAEVQKGTAPETARADAKAALAGIQKQLLEIRTKTRNSVQGVLTTEQVETLKSLRPNRR